MATNSLKLWTIHCRKQRIPDDFREMPVPETFDDWQITVKARTKDKALGKAKDIYGSIEQVDDKGKYIPNPDGSWTLTDIERVQELEWSDQDQT